MPTVNPKTRFMATLALLIPALAAGCGAPPAADTRPAWLDTPSDARPGLWTAAGLGDTRDAAIDDAMARLAQRVEARVAAIEVYQEGPAGETLDRRAHIETDVELEGAVILETRETPGGHAALVGIDPERAGRLLADRARAALIAEPPRLPAELRAWIERGAVMAPLAADWSDLRARYANGLAEIPARLDAPPAVADALRAGFGPGVSRAAWTANPARSHRPGERLTAWRLEAEVGGLGGPRVWSGVTRDADPARAAARAVLASRGEAP